MYDVLNKYAGGIGEFVVGLFTMASGLSLFLIFPTFLGFNFGPVLTIANTAWQWSLLLTATWVWFSDPQTVD